MICKDRVGQSCDLIGNDLSSCSEVQEATTHHEMALSLHSYLQLGLDLQAAA